VSGIWRLIVSQLAIMGGAVLGVLAAYGRIHDRLMFTVFVTGCAFAAFVLVFIVIVAVEIDKLKSASPEDR
jgi:ABC-type dipeptide/oligopeptide/nickel transport system permease component